jgi:hypothetical protein
MAYDEDLDSCVICTEYYGDCGCGSECQLDKEKAFYRTCVIPI